MKIYLDDQCDDPEYPNRLTPDGWVGAKNFIEFKATIERAIASGELIEAMDFDNDLGEGEMEGNKILDWVAEEYPDLVLGGAEIKIHSANSVARRGMEQQLESYRRNEELLRASHQERHPQGYARK